MLYQRAKRTLRASIDHSSRWLGQHNGGGKKPKLWVLMYHRVLPKADPRYALEEPGMVVEPGTFRMHLEVLQRHFEFLPLQEWISRWHNGQTLPPKSCALTFDDGWLDNFEYAFPLLKEKGIPATVFAVSHMVGTSDTFWPNKIARLLKNEPVEVLSTLPWLQPHLGALKQPSQRDAVAAVVHALKQHPDDQIHRWLESAEPKQRTKTKPSLMNWDQLRTMEASGLVDIGSHTCRHYRLGDSLNPAVIKQEIEESKRKLQENLCNMAPLFCYPNGDVCNLALRSVPQHYTGAVTTRRGINSASKLNPYELLRIGVHEDRCKTTEQFYSRLANWY